VIPADDLAERDPVAGDSDGDRFLNRTTIGLSLLVRICVASAHPLVHLRNLELPETADPVGRQAASLYPAVDRIFRDTQVRGDVIDRCPWFCHFVPV
jgi:hypothetical protein